MAADDAAGLGDVGRAGGAVQADREVPKGRHDGWAVAGTDLGAVFVEGHIAYPVQAILDAPVRAERVGELLCVGRVEAQVGDRVDWAKLRGGA